jgi:hypothetical protein
MTDAPQPNTAEARTPTGELKPVETPTVTTPTPEAPVADQSLLNTDEPKPEGEAKPEGAPEAYTDFKLPEGQTLDKETLDAARPLFKEMNLSQDQAQKLVDFYSDKVTKLATAPYDAYREMRTGWQNEVKAEYGAKLPEVKATIGRAIEALGDSSLQAGFRQAMDLTGAGDNPGFVKAFYKWSQMVTEGRPVNATTPSPLGQRAPGDSAKPSAAQALYPDLPSSSAPQRG